MVESIDKQIDSNMNVLVSSLDYFLDHEMVAPWLETIREQAMIEEGEEGDTDVRFL